MKNHKIDCKCMACKMEKGELSGKNNPAYKDGRSLIKHYCVDCNKELKNHKSLRCHSCATKGKNNPMFGKIGKLCPSFTHGLSCADKRDNYKCSSCGKPITHISAVYGSGKCHSCGGKGHSHQAWNKGIKNSTGHRLIETNKNTIIKHHIYLKENNEEIIQMPQGLHRSLHWKGYEYLVYLGIVKEYIKEFLDKYPEAMLAKDIRHHIDCNRENNGIDNFLWIASKEFHNKLHQEAYSYLVKQGMIKKYISWFFLMEKKNPKVTAKGGLIL